MLLMKHFQKHTCLPTAVEGDGVHGYQGEVFTSTPAQADVYSALTSHVHVTWNEGAITKST